MAGLTCICSFVVFMLASAHVSAFVIPIVPAVPTVIYPYAGPARALRNDVTLSQTPLSRPFNPALDVPGGMGMGLLNGNNMIAPGGLMMDPDGLFNNDFGVLGGGDFVGMGANTADLNTLNALGYDNLPSAGDGVFVTNAQNGGGLSASVGIGPGGFAEDTKLMVNNAAMGQGTLMQTGSF